MSVKLLRQRYAPFSVVLAALLTAAACGSSSATIDIVESQPELQPEAQPESRPGVVPHGSQYGDSVDDYLDVTGAQASSESAVPAGFTTVEWETLVPPGQSGEEIYARYTDRLNAAEPGSAEVDEIYAEMQAEYDNAAVNSELAGEKIFLAGFVAPLTYSGEIITEFLLVPYFGACIHVPPPPPNQTIVVSLEAGRGLTIEESWGAVWVTGTLTVSGAETDLATAGYSIAGAQTGVYESY